jgi:anti-sigma-K factor RskA
MSDTSYIPENDDALAAEYVLRLLDDADMRAAERRMRDDATFRAIVHKWEGDLSGLAAEVADVAPPPALKARVLSAVAPTGRSSARRLGWFGGLAFAAVAGFAVLTVSLRDGGSDPAPGYTAALVSQTGDLVINAGFVADDNLLIVSRTQGAARPGRVIELWLIAEGAAGPVSLGVLPDSAEARVSVPADIAALVPGGTLAVSDEPIGGSPTGAPTGEVMAAAAVTEI